ncbi:MAG: C2H2-type zinc finger protein [Armatimonadota bacterium]
MGSFLSTGDSDATQFACPVCGKKFASSQALAGHMRHCRGEEG